MSLKKISTAVLLILLSLQVSGDFVNPIRADLCETIIETHIGPKQIRVTLEIGLKDLPYFNELIREKYYTELGEYISATRNPATALRNGFQILADKNILIGNIIKQEIQPRQYRASLYTGKVDSSSTISKQVLFTEIVFPISSKPSSVTIVPPRLEGAKLTTMAIGIVAYHNGIPVNDLRFLATDEIIRLDWNDPWYSAFDNVNMKRHHNNSLMSFLYIDPYEVRHEVLIRVKDLEDWMALSYKLDDMILAEDQSALRAEIADFLASRNPVTIDGLTVDPIIDKTHFVEVQLSGIQILSVPKDLPYSSAIIGVIFAYPHDSIPGNVSVHWDMFSERINEVPSQATDPVGPMPYFLRPDDNVLVWTNYMKNYKLPTISEIKVNRASIKLLHLLGIILLISGSIAAFRKFKILAGISLVLVILCVFGGFYLTASVPVPGLRQTSFSKPEAGFLISKLLENTYRAFDFREESDIYDKLALSYDGDQLVEVYLETKKSLILEDQGGISVSLKKIELKSVEEAGSRDGSLTYRASWLAEGDVGHWGHIHQRTNIYDALIEISPRNGLWKITDIEMIREERL